MKKLFNWKIKENPEDFIVKEVAHFTCDEKGKHNLYLLIKRNLNTKEISSKLNLSYAGLKDKNALTFQYVSSEHFLGKTVFERIDKESFYSLVYLGKITKKIKIGNLEGNKFSVSLKNVSVHLKDFLINYFDTQRIENNWERGAEILFSDKKNSSWLDRFLIDAFLSYLWNKALEEMLKDNFEGYYLVDRNISFFIPDTDYSSLWENFPKFLPIPGYKIRFSQVEKDYYEKVLKPFNLNLSDFLFILRKRKIKGDYRKTFVKPENVYTKGNRLYFYLPKGSYGSMYLKHCF